MFNFHPIEIVGLLAAVFTTSAFVPQAYKTWKSKNVDSISLTMYLTMLIGVILWFIYGIYINSLSMVLANGVTSILVFCIVVMILKDKPKR
ncbi:SemiSWEET transporter [Gaetbulibacter sp. M240]|uniref:SemiSWEET family sugar transporter n=1 Tax=Gaetbulibacter sp. M240 TaxID=3126511 RepID=UPI00374E9D7E